jgi:hypothetical protein
MISSSMLHGINQAPLTASCHATRPETGISVINDD